MSRSAEQERLVGRVARFAELDEGSFVWTRDRHGWLWLGRICGPYFYDADEAFQEIHHPSIGGETQTIWDARTNQEAAN